MALPVVSAASILIAMLILTKGADWTTDALEALAKRWGTSRVALGVALVPVFSVLPELIVSLYAVQAGLHGIAFGNIIGSNIANIALMIGLSSFILSLQTPRRILLRDGVFLMAATLAASLTFLDGLVSREEGIILLAMYVPYLINVYEMEKTATKAEIAREAEEIVIRLDYMGGILTAIRTKSPVLGFVAGVAAMLLGGQLFIIAARDLITGAGISELLIGVTIVAVGTSIPDIVATQVAARKGYDDLIVSQTVGANLVSIMAALGLIALLSPLRVQASGSVLLLNLVALNLLTFILLLSMIRGRRIDKAEGLAILAVYASYVTLSALLA